ncbi:MAG: hypothetical protein JWN48_2528 [Myxococcaceae bacterium]|nr:hypothetical protein [Myxococcaceae bacterium]
MVIGIGIGAAVAVGTVAFLASKQPASFRIERSVIIAAKPSAVFPYLNDFHRWAEWSPYTKLDPNMKTTYTGPASGVGSVYEWSGNNKAGAGKMTVRDSQPDRRLALDLEFSRPMPATNTAEFTLEPVAEGVRVTWAMNGSNNFVGKAFSLLVDVDKMVGKAFEEGLTTLKGLVEASPAALQA